MSDTIQPLIVCMENNEGEKVSLKINPTDSFQIFLDNAKTLLGYEIDVDSVTNNQPVSLEDNIYTFLLNMEDDAVKKREDTPNFHEQQYELDDGTKIEASQIQFDNEDTIIDLSAVKIPYIKYADGSSEDEIKFTESYTTVDYVIPGSPQSVRSSSPKSEFANSLPFILYCKNVSMFESQFNKYLQASMKINSIDSNSTDNEKNECVNYKATKSRSEIMTREDILNMFKDSPVNSLPYEDNKNNQEKRRRKTDPLRLVNKNSNIKIESEQEKSHQDHECCICDKMITNKMEKSYIFDKEDQIIHRSELKKTVTHLKVLCTYCLINNFQPSLMKSPSQSLNNDEYLVIQNNQQFIFQKITPIVLKKISIDLNTIISNGKSEHNPNVGQNTKPALSSRNNSDDVGEVKDANIIADDIEIIEPDLDCDDINNIEDETVKEFLGKYEKYSMDDKELKCRFCDKLFEDVLQVAEHGEEHKHNLDDGPLYPCPLCDYGYTQCKWLKCHIKAVHDKTKVQSGVEHAVRKEPKGTLSREPSPVAKRTRSSFKKNDHEIDKDGEETSTQEIKAEEARSPLVLITEVKQECLDSSDEEAIWIVQAEAEANDKRKQDSVGDKSREKLDRVHKCNKCLEILNSSLALKAHKCGRKRGRKRNTSAREDSIKKPKKKKSKTVTDAQIVTCDNCNESFSSKVRLKFHMQFHESTAMLTATGEYVCAECDGAMFASETELFDHVHFQHDKRRRWQCPLDDCGKTFFLRATLTKHCRTHTDTRRYVCVTCGKRFLDKQTLDEHGVTHLQIKPFSCHICLKQLTRRSRLRMHLRTHEEEPAPRLVLACAVCRRAFATPATATEHITRSSECLEEFALELKKDTEPELLSPTTGLVTQNSENKASKLSDPIDREVSTAESAALLAAVEDAARAIVRVVNIEKAFRCEYCEDVFYMEAALNNHRMIHKGVKNPFTCHICKVSFATYSRCTTHKTTHGFYKRTEKAGAARDGGPNAGILGYGGFPVAKHFLCEECGRSYLHWTYLQVHRRMKHHNQHVLFQCNDCHTTFPNSWSVAYHRRKVHGKSSGDDGVTKINKENYRIPCRDCDQLLPNKNALYKHRLQEHSDASIAFANADSRQEHSTCVKCGLKILKLEDNQNHMSDVQPFSGGVCTCGLATRACGAGGAGERRYYCELCDVSFLRAATMREHRQLHAGGADPSSAGGSAGAARPWACERCPRRFRALVELRTHLRLKHPASLAVIEIEGLNISPDQVLNYLKMKNIQQQNVLEVTVISFAKGSTNVVPNSARALSLLNDVPRTHIIWEQPNITPATIVQQRPRDDSSHSTRPSILRHGTGTVQDYFSIPTDDFANMSAYNMELLLQEGGLVNGNQMVQLQLDDDVS